MKSKFFILRNEKVVQIKLDSEDEPIEVTICVPNNYQHDSMMEEFTDIGVTGEVVVRGADLIEERLIRFLIDLPFDIPKDENMGETTQWDVATIDEKRLAIRMIDPRLRDAINNAIVGEEEVDAEEASN